MTAIISFIFFVFIMEYNIGDKEINLLVVQV